MLTAIDIGHRQIDHRRIDLPHRKGLLTPHEREETHAYQDAADKSKRAEAFAEDRGGQQRRDQRFQQNKDAGGSCGGDAHPA